VPHELRLHHEPQGLGILLNDRGQTLVDAAYRALEYRSDAGGVCA
jgi:hypothetical protein